MPTKDRVFEKICLTDGIEGCSPRVRPELILHSLLAENSTVGLH
jgi:hypothetical protein